jgi:hypothetical protein
MATTINHTISTNNVVADNASYSANPNDKWTFASIKSGQQHQWPPGQYQWTPGTTNPYTFPQPLEPKEGDIGIIGGVPHRYEGGIWTQIEPSDETIGAPEIRIVLDASAMLNALRAYRDFLESLDGLDQETHNIVDDTLFGLREAIEALEKIGLQQD